MSGQALLLNCKGRAKILLKKRILPFPLLFKGEGRERVKVIINFAERFYQCHDRN
jgi:hypothetical protein